MSDEITIDGEQFVSSKRASELSGYKQDYIGQLSRGGQILARRVGGLWYVSSSSLMKYKEHAEEYKPIPPVNDAHRSDPDSLLAFDGKGYISTVRAAKLTGYNVDYVGQMARAGIVPSRQVGNRWYVEQGGLLKHKESKDALLGAVQAQSVGLQLPVTKDTNTDGEYSTPAPFFQYTSDNRELLPSTGAATIGGPPITYNDGGANKELVKEEEEEKEEAYVIPIHIHRERQRMLVKSPIRMPTVTEPRRAMLPMIVTAGLLTIVIVLSLGFVSLKESSVYTSNATQEGVGTARLQAIEYNRMSDSSAQIASAAVSLIGKAADLLEILIAPELKYQRQK